MSAHRERLVALVQEHGWKRGAELGVDRGILYGMLLRDCPELFLIGVDTFPDRERSKRAFELERSHRPRAGLLTMTTREASKAVPDGEFDFVFIDADHSERSVTEDIMDWKSKVKKGGWLGGHDYSRKFPGVIKAVDRIFGKRVHELPGTIWGVWV